MKAKIYPLLDHAIELGISRGYAKAFKHTGHPTEQQIRDNIHNAVMTEICEWFSFADEETFE